VLVSAMLVVPTAAAGQVTRRWQVMLGLSMLIAALSLVGGLLLSFASPGGAQLPAGPAAVLLATVCFALAAITGTLRRRALSRIGAATR